MIKKYKLIECSDGKTLDDIKDQVSMLLHIQYNGDLSCEDPDDIVSFVIEKGFKALLGGGNK